MEILFYVFAILGIPLALILSLVAGISVLKHRKLLGALIIIATLAAAPAILWEMRYDLRFMGIFRTLDGDFIDLDLSEYFKSVVISLVALMLFVRLRWKKEYGKGIVLILALISWALAAAPHMMLSPGAFLH
ncbi:MAG: hypothetical protein KUG69_13315 [Marinosulfonomonas sp.]|nr:hypothetical protein [Marinosulfonomonas sp.]